MLKNGNIKNLKYFIYAKIGIILKFFMPLNYPMYPFMKCMQSVHQK